jgi:hypothetical protein
VPKIATKKRKCVKGSSYLGDQTSAQELVRAKPLKASQKFSLRSSGLSIIEKTSFVNVKISRGKTSSTSMGGGGLDWAPAHALDLFNSGSSASDDEFYFSFVLKLLY